MGVHMHTSENRRLKVEKTYTKKTPIPVLVLQTPTRPPDSDRCLNTSLGRGPQKVTSGSWVLKGLIGTSTESPSLVLTQDRPDAVLMSLYLNSTLSSRVSLLFSLQNGVLLYL